MKKFKRKVLAMLMTNNFGSSLRQQLFDSAPFCSELLYTAIPQRAAFGTTGTFTRATTSTWPNNDGYLVTGVAGEIGFVGARRVRNLIPSSESFATGWAAPGASSVSANAILSPIGTLTADALIEDGTTAFHRINHASVTRTSGQVIAVSVYAKYAGRNLFMNWNSFCNATGAFNLQTGEVTQGAGVASIEALDDGWYRCTVIGTCTTTGADNGYLQLTPTNVSGSYAGDGVSGAYFWGAQLEDVTAQTTQTAGEYVSVGVESAPYYHGSMVDGVKCFPTDLAGNPLPTEYTYDAVSLNGVAGTYVSTPDSVANSITGDIDIRVKVALNDWTPAAQNVLAAKYEVTGAQRGYEFSVVATTGVLALYTSPDGTAFTNTSSSVAPTVADGATLWVRVTRVADSGVTNYYTSTDGTNWSQLGTPNLASTAGGILDSTAPLALGMRPNGSTGPTAGTIYRAQIYNGINGTLAVDFDASRYAGGTTLTGSTGETWTLQGNAVIHPTNTPILGYSAEGARTNLCLQSNAFTTTWTDSGAAPVQNAAGPDGATSAWTLTDNSAVASEQINQSITLTAATHTLSVFVKKTTGAQATYPALSVYNAGIAQTAACTIDTTNGVATVWTAYTGLTIATSSARCSSYNADFWRVELTFLPTAAAWFIFINPAVTTNATQSTGIFDVTAQGSAVFYGAQVELGAFASSYIATTTAAVTRNADVLTYSGGDVPNLKTLTATFKRESGVESVGWAVALSDGTISNYESISAASATEARFLGVTGGVTQWDVIPSYTAGTTSKAAFSAATNDIKMAKDGVAQTQDTSATVPTVTQLNVGHVAGSFQFSGNVGGIYGWTRNLSQSELNAVTS